MYRAAPLGRDILQGDIVRPVPLVEAATIQHRSVDGPLEIVQQEAQSRISHRMVVVLSHSCDTTLRTPAGNPVVVSPMVEIAPIFRT